MYMCVGGRQRRETERERLANALLGPLEILKTAETIQETLENYIDNIDIAYIRSCESEEDPSQAKPFQETEYSQSNSKSPSIAILYLGHRLPTPWQRI